MKVFVRCGRIAVVVLSIIAGACGAADNSGKHGLDINVHDEATPADAGLPKYPGAKAYKESDQSSSGANLGFSIPGFQLKVVAMNLESADRPEQVAAFYRKALSKYGRVLDCSDTAKNKKNAKTSDEESDELTCDEKDPGSHTFVYKVGRELNQRTVAIKPHGAGTRFSLAYVSKRE